MAQKNSPQSILANWLQVAFTKVFPAETEAPFQVRVVAATNPDFGDFQCNDAMALAKRVKQPPRTVAASVVEALEPTAMVSKVEIAGPGFINLTVDAGWLAQQLEEQMVDEHLGITQEGKGKTVVMDYSSPNVAKPMHIGHIRSTVIGNALDRLLRARGYQVIADNHLGDWGTQFGILICGYREFLTPEQQQNLTVELLEKVYVQSYNRTKEDPSWLEQCRNELVKLQQGDEGNRAVWKRFIDISIQEFTRVYDRLDVKFDLWRGESYYNEQLPGVVEQLKQLGLATPSEGAWIVDLKDEGLDICIVRKSDGGYNYATTDIATVASRKAEFDPAAIIYVTDERQQLHFKQFFAICKKIGMEATLEHVWFGLMRLPEGTFSTRQGNVIKLEALLDEAEARALKIIRESHPEMTEAEQRSLAADIGISAVKYADLSHDPQSLVVFSWDKALALDGNSGPYLQYAYARLCSLLDKYGQEPTAKLAPSTPIEKQLVLQLLRFPESVERASRNSKPSILADYLYELARCYSRFYQSSPVLKAEAEVRDARIQLCSMTACVLERGLHLLGIRTPRRI